MANRQEVTYSCGDRADKKSKNCSNIPTKFVLIGSVIFVIIFIITTVCLSMPDPLCVKCEPNWIVVGGKCYYLANYGVSGSDADSFCKSRDGFLTYHNNTNILNLKLTFGDFWVGIKRSDDNTTWVWSNGTTMKTLPFSIQRGSIPANTKEYVFESNGVIKSGNENKTAGFICAKF